MLMASPVDLIKERLNIVDVVSMYITLLPAGKNFKARSPFKQEKTPSFFVSPDKGLYHCFSTNKGGDMFTFVQEMEGLDFRGALKVLADKAGVSLVNFDPKEKEKKDKLYEIMEGAARFFEESLDSRPDVLEYIKGRGIEDATIKEFRIGFAPSGWRNLHDKLSAKFSVDDMYAVGLVKKTDRGAYDTFRGRIMFPICDSSGRVIAFSGRIFEDDSSGGDSKPAKYVNSPDTPLFNKSDVLFGLDKAKNYIRKYNFTTIVEGQFDVIALHQAGFKNTVAVSGTALSDSLIGKDKQVNNLGIVKRLSNNLVLAFDSDTAGVNAARRSANIAMTLGMDVKVIDIEDGKDPADIIKEKGKDEWSKMLRAAKHAVLFYTRKIKNSAKDARDLAKKIKEYILPDLSLVDSEIEKEYFVKEVSEITGISAQNIYSDLRGLSVKNPAKAKEEAPGEFKNNTEEKFADLEKEIWGAYIAKDRNEDVKKQILDVVGEEEFKIMEEKFDKQDSEFIFGETDYESGFLEKLSNLKKKMLQKRYDKLREERLLAEHDGDDKRADELLSQEEETRKEIDKINNSRY
jgi:DNA primase